MDYERKYKEAIEIPFGAKDSELQEWVFTIPEGMEAEIKDGKVIIKRAESEDERIRKELVAVLEDLILPDDQRRRFLAYLEKQKERGPLTKEEEYILHRIIEYLEDETCPSEWISLLHDIYCLPYEKQKEQTFLPDNFDEAAREIVIKMHPCLKDCTILRDRLTRGELMALVKAGAEWMANIRRNKK